MNKFVSTSVIAALTALSLAACGGSQESVSEKVAPEATEVADVISVTRVIDGPLGYSTAATPAATDSVVSPEPTVTPEPEAPSAAETGSEDEENTDPPGSLDIPMWVPGVLDLDLTPVYPSLSDLARLGSLSPVSISQVTVGCSGSKALVSVEIGGGAAIASVVAQRLTLLGVVNTVDLVAGTTPGMYQGVIAGWFDKVSITVVDDLGRSVTQIATFDLAGC